jgi:hypothetical protein
MKLFIPLEQISLAFVRLQKQELKYDCENFMLTNVSFCFSTTDKKSIKEIKDQLTHLEDSLLQTFENKTYNLKNYHLEIGKTYFCSCYEIKESNSQFFIHFDMDSK